MNRLTLFRKCGAAPSLVLLVLVAVSTFFIPNVNAQSGNLVSEIIIDNRGSSDFFSVFSPKQVCYNQSSITLNFSLTAHTIATIAYSLDNQALQSVETEYVCTEENHYPPFLNKTISNQLTVTGNLVIENLANGNHSLRLYHGHLINHSLSFEVKAVTEVKFSIKAPVILLNQGQNCYSSDNIPVNLIVSESTRLVCSIDGKVNVTISGNTTLTNLCAGGHNITVYAFNKAGSCTKSNTVDFKILEYRAENQSPDGTYDDETVFPFSIVLCVAFMVLIFAMTAVVKRLERSIAKGKSSSD